ncbi:MAG TPA: MFS transporter [Campylobacterales bacterium]|nr:MFS transporter [Campylobacterales bacterium]
MHSKKFQKDKVFTLSFAHLSHDTFSSFLAPLLPLLIEKLGISLFMSAFLDIARRIPSLFNPFFGLIAEKTGAKYFVILTPAITAISMSLIGISSSYTMLIILLIVSGISSALFHIPSPTMIKETSGDRVGLGMSFFMVGGELARTVGPLLVLAGVSWWGLEGIYRLMPIGILASIILYIKLKDFDIDRPLTKPKEKGDVKRLLKKYRLFFIAIAFFIMAQSGMKSALTFYLPVYLVHQGESLWYAGISLSILQFFGILGTFLSGNISDKIGRKNTLFIATIGSILFMAFFIYTSNIIVLAFLGLFVFATNPVLLALVQDSSSHMPTFMNSIYMSINFGVSSFMVFVVGYLGDSYGLHFTYIASALIALVAVPMVFMLDMSSKIER